MKKVFSVAIDGPSGAGKSTIARTAASDMEFIYVDTGAIYRSVGLYAMRKGVDTKNPQAVVPLLDEIKIEIRYDDSGVQRMILNGEDVSGEIRTPQASIAASDVSKIPEVRSFLLELQRDFARKNSVIMDGRDIGTVVLPNADLKIFLTATAEARAKRRWLELKEKGMEQKYEDVLRDVIWRDKNDSERDVAPLKPAEDSVTVDTTELDLQQSIELIERLIRERLGV